MSKTYFTSDTHFNHGNIIEYCNRPFKSIEEMNRTIIEKWNGVVKPEDTVYHLGDFAMGPPVRWNDFLTSLNGKKILIRGNHDKNLSYMKDKVGFDEVHEKAEWNGWLLQHHPIKTNKKLLCGHIHQHWKRIDWVINAGVDVWDFQPRTIEELEAAPKDNATFSCKNCSITLHRLENNRDHFEGKCLK